MVYRGRPSKACQPCRKRKLVCDLKVHGCSQCRRAKLICHGYRDTDALRVNDQSSAVTRKFQNSGTDPRPKSTATAPQLEAQDLIPTPRHAEAIPQIVAIPTSSQAKDLFYYNYVVGTLKPFDFLQAYDSLASKDEHLTKSMEAVALAYLNYQRHAASAQSEARQHYVTALRLLNKAIQDPEFAKKDSTLLSILLLDLYEKITNKQPHYEGSWATHLQGALTLVKLRGDMQYDDPIALRLLTRLTTNEIISCVASHRPVPEEVVALRANIGAIMFSPADPNSQKPDLLIEFARLQHDIEAGALPALDAITALKDLDGRFVALSLEVQPTWWFKTVQVEEKSNHHFESYHHVYLCEQMGQMWNVLRLTRILVNDLILSRCSGIDEFPSPNSQLPTLRQHTTKTINEMASEICATVPQYINDPSSDPIHNLTAIPKILPQGTSKRKQRPKPFKQTTSPNPTHHLPCYRLIFPLYIAAQSTASTPTLRPWAIQQLRFMADYHAIENAARVANILDLGENIDPWLVYAMLGSYAFVC